MADAGLSEAAVSRVLHAKPGVAAETCQASLEAMDWLGGRLAYAPAALGWWAHRA